MPFKVNMWAQALWRLVNKSVAEYEAEFLRLSRYVRGPVSNDYEKSVWFEKGLRYDLKVLIAFQREQVFVTLVDKTKIAEEVKHTKHEKRDREKSQNKNKRDSGPSSFFQWPMKQAKFDRPLQAKLAAIVEPVLKVEQVLACGYCNWCHPDESWRRIWACFRYGAVGHKISECLLMVEPS
ncbi:Zinc finger CCHC domain-containing 8 [Gossypium australe]|uniref:Zinc finger CCHC domain-containing 8 n=1 Tax=Gossypium australe TaxID=47621 RepID=A0A5B6VZ86_9ROSI|nr:Zinc finger CCHC domain-containing 8 [Gossypium australe]